MIREPIALQPAFADRLPERSPTLRELALAAVLADKEARDYGKRYFDNPATFYDDESSRLDDAAFDATQAFFAALERETGISRALFGQVGCL